MMSGYLGIIGHNKQLKIVRLYLPGVALVVTIDTHVMMMVGIDVLA